MQHDFVDGTQTLIQAMATNFNGGAVEIWEWISNFTPHLVMDVIAYPYVD